VSGFGLDNLPYGVVAPPGQAPCCVVRLGDGAVDLDALHRAGRLGPRLPPGVFAGDTLNPFLALGAPLWREVRERLQDLDPEPDVALEDAEARLPVTIGDYVDFYSSLEHATNLGRLFRPDAEDPLLPNWRRLPVGYHGRAGTVVVSGTPIARPCGQRPSFGPTEQLDIELELGFITGGPPRARIPADEAAGHVFGFVLVNDWSARDIQRFEYQPLGPFLGKSFATSISPWIVPLDALRRVPAPPQDPEPLPYLRVAGDWALDVALEIELNGEIISRGNARGLYWTFPQQLAHATVNGATARPGDLFASGTISGAENGSEGSLIELGRPFLRDGDTVVLRAERFGEVRGTVRPPDGAAPPTSGGR
jgi:fumarylacetoacetase